MNHRQMKWIASLSMLLAASFLAGRVQSQDMLRNNKAFTVTDKDNVERFRVDLNSLTSDQAVELVLSPNKTFTIVTQSTNSINATVDNWTNIVFVDASTNLVGRIDAPNNNPNYNLRRSTQVNQVPGLLK